MGTEALPAVVLDARWRCGLIDIKGQVMKVRAVAVVCCSRFGLASGPTPYAGAGGSGAALRVTVIPPDHFEWHPPHRRAVSAS